MQNALEHKYICDKYRVVAVMDSQRYFKDMISGPVKIMKTTLVNVHFMLGSKMRWRYCSLLNEFSKWENSLIMHPKSII